MRKAVTLQQVAAAAAPSARRRAQFGRTVHTLLGILDSSTFDAQCDMLAPELVPRRSTGTVKQLTCAS